MSSRSNLAWVEVEKAALLHNFRIFQKDNPQAKVAPVLKANAYGHGLEEVGKLVERQIKPKMVILDSLAEVVRLRRAGVELPVLLIGPISKEQMRQWRDRRTSFAVYSKESLAILNKYQPGAGVHLKIDSGMNRLGFRPSEMGELVLALKRSRLKVEGIYSHLASPRNKDAVREQLGRFRGAMRALEAAGWEFKWKHIGSTAGSQAVKDEFNLVRIGIGFYGYGLAGLRPALTLKTWLVQVKDLEKGERVGYDWTFRAKRKMKLGVLAMGYYQGLPRSLSNKGWVRVGDSFGRILGRVCMNMTMVDLSRVKEAGVGQEVTVFSNRMEDKNNAAELAELAGTNTHEILARISESLPRVIK